MYTLADSMVAIAVVWVKRNHAVLSHAHVLVHSTTIYYLSGEREEIVRWALLNLSHDL